MILSSPPQSSLGLALTLAFTFASGCTSESGEQASDSLDSSAGTEGDETGETEAVYASCEADEIAGRFTVQLQDGYTQVEGQVFDAPDLTPKVELAVDGACKLLKIEGYDCDPGCDSDSECTASGCQSKPSSVDVGTVNITGLASQVVMTPNVVNFYLNLAELAHPGFEPGADLQLTAEGNDVDAPFEMRATGSDDLVVLSETIEAAPELPVVLDWTPPSQGADTRIHLDLDIGHHGGSPASIECEVADTGHFEIPASLVTPLFDYGVAGFPALTITRRSIGSAMVGERCLELLVAPHGAKEAVVIEGLTSCNSDEECPEGMTCLADSSCG